MSVTADLGPLTNISAAEWARRTRAGEFSAREGIEAVLRALPAVDAELNAVSRTLADGARAHAARLDEQAAEERGPLHGVPIAVKEEFDVAGLATTYGTAGQTTPARRDSAVVAALREAGAVVIATTRMPEFGAWPLTESQTGGITRNPRDPARTPGGSSGGSAALLAAGAVPLAVGSDGGGSLRIPAAHCGVVGLKPSRGVISPAPHDSLWVSLGTGGLMARTVADLRLGLQVLNPGAFNAVEAGPLSIATTTKSPTALARAHRSHRTAVREAGLALTSAGHRVEPLEGSLPDPTLAFMPQYLRGIAEGLGRLEHPERAEARSRFLARLGRGLPGGLIDAAQQRGENLARRVDELLGDADVLLLPTVATRPATAGSFLHRGAVTSGFGAIPSIAFTALFNVTGHPALAVPFGTGADGLPLSVQLVARRGQDARLLAVGGELEASASSFLAAES